MGFERKRKGKSESLEKAKKEVSKRERTQLCLWVDKIEHRQLKALAAMDGITITEVIGNSINLYIMSKAKRK